MPAQQIKSLVGEFVYPIVFSNAYGAFEALRRLGFQSDDINLVTDVADCVFVQLRDQDRVFNIGVGFVGERTHEELFEMWRAFCDELAHQPEEVLTTVFFDWVARHGGTNLTAALLLKGFKLPNVEAELQQRN